MPAPPLCGGPALAGGAAVFIAPIVGTGGFGGDAVALGAGVGAAAVLAGWGAVLDVGGAFCGGAAGFSGGDTLGGIALAVAGVVEVVGAGLCGAEGLRLALLPPFLRLFMLG